MKVIHLADLHLGKTFHKMNIIEDQKYVLEQILNIMDEDRANLIIAGDIFDSANPSLEAQELFLFLMQRVSEICKKNDKKCFIIVGNHDSNRRLLLWRTFLLPEITIVDSAEWVEIEGIRFYFLSFVKPVNAQLEFDRYFDSYREAFQMYISDVPLKEKTVLVAHQTFEGVTTGSSESMSFFDDSIPLKDVSEFALVMAGHIHKKQKIQNVFYPGSLLPYAFGDVFTHDIREWGISDKGDSLLIDYLDKPIRCKHELKIIQGDLEHCLNEKDNGEFVKVELIEENLDLDLALSQLKSHFMNLITVTSGIKDTWEADLDKPSDQFKTFEEALDSFCNQIDIPVFDNNQMKYIKEVLDEVTNRAD